MTLGSTEILISLREPFNKNVLWVYPKDNEIELKVFDKGWKVLFTTKDKGLSRLSSEQVKDIANNINKDIVEIVKKHIGRYSSNSLVLLEYQKKLENRIKELEETVDKLSKKVTKLNGRK